MLGDIQALGGQLVAISPEVPDVAKTTAEKNQLAYDLLSDEGNKVARAFGLVFDVPPDLQAFYKSINIDLSAHNGGAGEQLPLAATFVIDPAGIIQAAYADADYVKRMEPDEILDTLKRIRTRLGSF